jgi:hypothetical protein
MQDHDIVAERLPDGRYVIRRWEAATHRLVEVEGSRASYDEAEMYRRLDELRAGGDTYIRDRPDVLRLVP